MADNFKNSIPVEELVLSNGDTVVFYKYLTTGESREMQRMILGGGTFNVAAGKINDLQSTIVLDMQDKGASFLVKEVKHKDGVVEPFTQLWLDHLPLEDGNKVYDKVNQLNQVSQLTPTEKKV